MANKIHTKSALALGDVEDKSKIEFPSADMHAPDGSGNGLARKVPGDILYQALMYEIIAETGHGLTGTHIGFALNGTAVIDDTNAGSYPTGVLVEVIDVDTIRVAPPGTTVTLDVALLEDGNLTDISTTGRFMFWDFSLTCYCNDLPADSAVSMPEMLEVISVGASTFTARVRGY